MIIKYHDLELVTSKYNTSNKRQPVENMNGIRLNTKLLQKHKVYALEN